MYWQSAINFKYVFLFNENKHRKKTNHTTNKNTKVDILFPNVWCVYGYLHTARISCLFTTKVIIFELLLIVELLLDFRVYLMKKLLKYMKEFHWLVDFLNERKEEKNWKFTLLIKRNILLVTCWLFLSWLSLYFYH